jgi:hypothetical protein
LVEPKNRERNRTNRKQNEYRITNTKQKATTVPVKYCDYKDRVMRVAGILQVPNMSSKDILFQAKGESSWSSPLRSDGSLDDQAGEAGLVEL